jgi:hypothetical protein
LNVRSLYASGSLTAIARELESYKLHLMGVQKVRWDKGGIVKAGDYTFSMEMKRKPSIRNKRFVHRSIVSAVKTVEFVSGRILYIVLRIRWCNIFVLNVLASSNEKVTIQKRVFMQNQYRFAVIFISTI